MVPVDRIPITRGACIAHQVGSAGRSRQHCEILTLCRKSDGYEVVERSAAVVTRFACIIGRTRPFGRHHERRRPVEPAAVGAVCGDPKRDHVERPSGPDAGDLARHGHTLTDPQRSVPLECLLGVDERPGERYDVGVGEEDGSGGEQRYRGEPRRRMPPPARVIITRRCHIRTDAGSGDFEPHRAVVTADDALETHRVNGRSTTPRDRPPLIGSPGERWPCGTTCSTSSTAGGPWCLHGS